MLLKWERSEAKVTKQQTNKPDIEIQDHMTTKPMFLTTGQTASFYDDSTVLKN